MGLGEFEKEKMANKEPKNQEAFTTMQVKGDCLSPLNEHMNMYIYICTHMYACAYFVLLIQIIHFHSQTVHK